MKQAMKQTSWLDAVNVYSHPRVVGMLFLGFSAGLPLLLVLGTFSFWLAEAKINRSTIGHLSWIGLAYGFKWLWSPLIDRMPIPFLTQNMGKRRSWLLVSQIAIIISLIGMAFNDPAVDLMTSVFWAIALAFSSATQDIALDAYRIEAVDTEKQGAMSASYQAGYRLAMIMAGAGALWIAAAVDPSEATYDYSPWKLAYSAMALCMLVGIICTLIIREPTTKQHTEKILDPTTPITLATILNKVKLGARSIIAPFMDFIDRYKWQAFIILSLVAVYRISDVVMGVMSNPFYKEIGFTKDEVANVSKVFGVIMTILGAGVGGVLVAKMGVMRSLFLGALLSALTNLLFVWIVGVGHDVNALIITVSADNLSSGIASSAFMAYLSGLTNRAHSATQYALMTSIMLLIPKFIAGFSGDYVNIFGWANFFTATAIIGMPVLLLVWLASKVKLLSDNSLKNL